MEPDIQARLAEKREVAESMFGAYQSLGGQAIGDHPTAAGGPPVQEDPPWGHVRHPEGADQDTGAQEQAAGLVQGGALKKRGGADLKQMLKHCLAHL